MKNPETNQT